MGKRILVSALALGRLAKWPRIGCLDPEMERVRLPKRTQNIRRNEVRKFLFSLALAALTSPVSGMAQVAFVPDGGSSNVSVVDTTSNTVLGTIPVGTGPVGVAITPDGRSMLETGDQARSRSSMQRLTPW